MRASAHPGSVDRLTAADLVPLRTDVGPVPLHLGALLTLSSGVGADEVETAVRNGLGSMPRLRQVVRRARHGGGAVWREDSGFDAADHVTRRRCDDPGDLDSVLDLAEEVLTEPFPTSRPPWRAVVVTGPHDETAHAVVVVLHHVLADGVGGLSLLAGLVDEPPPAGVRPPPPAGDAAEPPPRTLWWLRSVRWVQSVGRAWHELGDSRPGTAPPTSLNRPTGPRRVMRVVTIGLDTVRTAARRQDVTVNDVLLVAVTGAMAEVLRRRGEVVPELVVSVPVSARPQPDGELGNRVGVMPIRVPLDGRPQERLQEVGRRTRERRAEVRGESAALVGPAFRLLAAARVFRWFIERQRLVNSFLTNVPGPGRTMSVCGSPIEHIVPMATTPGNVGASFAVLSYAGELVITVITDPDVVPEIVALTNALDFQLRLLVADDGTSSPGPAALCDRTLGA